MVLRVLLGCGALLLCGLSVAAQDVRETDVVEEIIAAPIQEVWNAFTTKAGIEGFMAAHAEVDLRVGGSIQTHYGDESQIGDPGTIRHVILVLDPGRLYSARVDFPFNEQLSEIERLLMETWGIVEFEAISPDITLVRMSSCNYGSGGTWDDIRAFFKDGNAYVIGKLKEYLEAPDVPTMGRDVMRLMGVMAGGEWRAVEEMPDGNTLRTRSVTTLDPDGRSLTSKGWLDDGRGEFWHSSLKIWQDPATGLVWFVDVNQDGDITRGVITIARTNTVSWDWNAVATNGERSRYRVEQHFVAEDVMVQKIFVVHDDGTETKLVETTNRREPAEIDEDAVEVVPIG